MRLLMLVVCALVAVGCTSGGEVPETTSSPAPSAASSGLVAPTIVPTAVPTSAATLAPTPPAAPTATPLPTAPSVPTPAAPDPLATPADGSFTAPDDPAELAALLTAAAEAIRDPAAPPAAVARAAHWQQVVYRRLGHDAELAPPVLAALPPALRASAEANVFAGARLFAMHSPEDPETPVEVRDLPAWRIVEPPPAEELLAHYRRAEAETGVHWTYLAAVHLVETRMGRIQGTSVAGAQGPMQFMPATWAEWGEGDVNDPGDAILAAARYLDWGGMPEDVDGALYRYNNDVRYVDAVRTYAQQMQANPRAYDGYYHWQVYYFTGAENVWLPHGYDGS